MFQRPQHLLTRYAQRAEVTYFEEPVFENIDSPTLRVVEDESGVKVATPVLPSAWSPHQSVAAQRDMVREYRAELGVVDFITWYYTPMALLFTGELSPLVTVYDCMDELSAFDGAPAQLIDLEAELFRRADIVFTGGQSLYEAKRMRHTNIHAYPSSIDRSHFASARDSQPDPEDQASIPHPRVGFFGVLDERLDRELVAELAAEHPDWHFILIGPVAKIRAEDLPRGANLHYLGLKSYAELPRYLAGWEVAILPFARNRATRFISPTKTPEYLAAAKPVVSTSIHDVIHPYGDLGLVRIADDAAKFGEAIEASLQESSARWIEAVDSFLDGNSWDKTFKGMMTQLEICVQQRMEASHSGRQEEGSFANV